MLNFFFNSKMNSEKETQIEELLRANKYKNVDIIKKDVIEVLNTYKGLTYQVEMYVRFNTLEDLFNLQGTIPVTYKNNTYNIPICIWLRNTHPNDGPICYVKPTPTMKIKVSKFVDSEGKIFLPYLHEWSPSNSDLLGLIEVMTVTFTENPPVFSTIKALGATLSGSSIRMPQPDHILRNLETPLNLLRHSSNNSSYGNSAYHQSSDPAITGNNLNTIPTCITVTDEQSKMLINVAEDKLRKCVQQRVYQCQAEIDILNRTKQELAEERKKIKNIIKNFINMETKMEEKINALKETQEELVKSMQSLEKENNNIVSKTG